MTTRSTGLPAEGRSRWGAIGGLVFFVLFVVGFLLGGDTPEYDARDREWVEWFEDDGNTNLQVVAMFLLVASALALLCFLAVLTRRLRATNRPELVNVAIGAGLVLAAMLIVGAIGMNQVSAAVTFGGDYPVPDADVLRQSEQIGFGVILLGGGWSGALLVGATSLAARGSDLLPRWLVIASEVVGVVLLFSVFFIPFVLLPLWVLTMSIVMLRRPAPA
jgi:uncharacterized membrane protein YhaH (DUF805 family)